MTLCELVHMMQRTPQQSDEALLLWMRDLVDLRERVALHSFISRRICDKYRTALRLS